MLAIVCEDVICIKGIIRGTVAIVKEFLYSAPTGTTTSIRIRNIIVYVFWTAVKFHMYIDCFASFHKSIALFRLVNEAEDETNMIYLVEIRMFLTFFPFAEGAEGKEFFVDAFNGSLTDLDTSNGTGAVIFKECLHLRGIYVFTIGIGRIGCSWFYVGADFGKKFGEDVDFLFVRLVGNFRKGGLNVFLEDGAKEKSTGNVSVLCG